MRTALRLKSSWVFLNVTSARGETITQSHQGGPWTGYLQRWKGRLKTTERKDSCLQRALSLSGQIHRGRFKAAKAGVVWCIDTAAKHLRQEVKVAGWLFKVCDIGTTNVWSAANLCFFQPHDLSLTFVITTIFPQCLLCSFSRLF